MTETNLLALEQHCIILTARELSAHAADVIAMSHPAHRVPIINATKSAVVVKRCLSTALNYTYNPTIYNSVNL